MKADVRSGAMLGAQQEAWLFDGLDRSRTAWNGLGNQVFMPENDRTPGESGRGDPETGTRTRACDPLTDFSRPTATFARRGPGRRRGDRRHVDQFRGRPRSAGPRILLWAHQVGESPLEVPQQRARLRSLHRGRADASRADVRVVDTVRAPTATVATCAQFVVQSGTPGIQLVSG
jgi:alkaline phosphatase D